MIPGTSRATLQPMACSTPNIRIAPKIKGMIAWVAPPPAFPQPAEAAFAVPTTLGANMTLVWYCVMTKLAPIAPINRRKNKNDS